MESSKNWTQTNKTDFESGKTLMQFKIDINDSLANKYADLMSRNDKLEPIIDNEEEHRMLKRKRELQL